MQKLRCRARSERKSSLTAPCLRNSKGYRLQQQPQQQQVAGRSVLHRGTLSKMSARGQSTVARTSLAARHRWEWALRRVLTMNKVLRVLQESSLYGSG